MGHSLPINTGPISGTPIQSNTCNTIHAIQFRPSAAVSLAAFRCHRPFTLSRLSMAAKLSRRLLVWAPNFLRLAVPNKLLHSCCHPTVTVTLDFSKRQHKYQMPRSIPGTPQVIVVGVLIRCGHHHHHHHLCISATHLFGFGAACVFVAS